MRTNDLYETHPRFVEDLLDHITPQFPVGSSVAEICCGNMAITSVLAHTGYRVFNNDLIQREQANGFVQDTALNARYRFLYDELQSRNIEWIISNLPFTPSIALEICEVAVGRGFKCAFILPLNFLEPSLDREHFLLNHPRTGEIVLPRYSFTGDGKTNMYGVAWQLWNTKPIGNYTAPRL